MYRVRVGPDWADLRRNFGNKVVIFRDHSGSSIPIPLPLPDALAIHASFAKVFHASGAADFFQNALKDQELLKVLATDGSTDLSIALRRLLINTGRIIVAQERKC